MNYFNEELLIPVIIFLFLIIIYFILNKYFMKITMKSRVTTIKGKKESSDLLISNVNSDNTSGSNSFLQRQIDALIEANKKAIVQFKLVFEQCGWNPQIAPIIVPIIKIGGVFLFIVFFLIIESSFPQVSNLPNLVKAGILLIFIFLGFRSFDYTVGIVRHIRYGKLEITLPTVIDLLLICTRAGLSLDKSIDRIAQEMAYLTPDMAEELAITSAELSILPNRRMALENLAKRIDIPIVKSLTLSLIQAEEQGVSIGQTLQVLSKEFSKQRLLDLEAKAARLPSLLTLPMMLFSLPVLLILILGPGLTKMIEGNFLGNMSNR